VIPFLGDSPTQLRTTVRAIAAAGATSVTPLALHLRPGAREWYLGWLNRHHPHLVRHYEALYASGAYAPKWYQRRITRQVHELAAEYGVGPATSAADSAANRRIEPAAPAEEEDEFDDAGGNHCTQLTLL
jgi:DNA repair photolyase